MNRLKSFLRTTLIGGVVVILPTAILVFVLKWVFDLVTGLIQPLTNLVVGAVRLQEIVADVVVIALILALCFFVGAFVRTRAGSWIFHSLEGGFLRKVPGYSVIKETVVQLVGTEKSPFSTVALVQLFGSDTLVSAFVTDEHPDGSYTVFMPTGPNPTSGNIYHLRGEYVHPLDIPVDEAMRSIISCGAGSTQLIEAYRRASSPDPGE